MKTGDSMEYYCIMVNTGEEKSFKNRALEQLKETYPLLQIYCFERDMYTEKRGWYKRALFPGYLFIGVEKLTPLFIASIKKNKRISQIFTG